MRRRRKALPVALAILASLILLIWVLNLPFYAGSSLGPSAGWRMEHGRLTLRFGGVQARETFYVDLNSEGLRWAPEVRRFAPADWRITIPLWIPFMLVVVGALAARRRDASAPSAAARA